MMMMTTMTTILPAELEVQKNYSYFLFTRVHLARYETLHTASKLDSLEQPTHNEMLHGLLLNDAVNC
jgi:hypothetical protein